MIAPLTCIVAICLLPCAEGTVRSSQAAQRPVNGHAKASGNSGNPHLPTRPGGSQSTGTPADKSRRSERRKRSGINHKRGRSGEAQDICAAQEAIAT